MTTCISILSDQLIPNVLFIKQMTQPGDNHIFLTTKKMEADKKSAILVHALQLSVNSYKVIEIDANNPALILEKLDYYEWPASDSWIVNITGGTKMMSQMAYIHFSEKAHTKIYYWPIGSQQVQLLHPFIEAHIIKQPVYLNLPTYLAAQGYSYTAQAPLSHPFAKANRLFKQAIAAGNAGQVPEIAAAKKDEYFGPDKVYFAGGWFEEWLYYFMKTQLQLADDQIAYNLKLKHQYSQRKSESDNEVDVAFVYGNRLFIWECKVFNHIIGLGKKLPETVYKISSLSQSLGLQAVSFVVIFTPFGEDTQRKEFLNDITRLMRINKVFSMEDLVDTELFIEQVKKIMDYGT